MNLCLFWFGRFGMNHTLFRVAENWKLRGSAKKWVKISYEFLNKNLGFYRRNFPCNNNIFVIATHNRLNLPSFFIPFRHFVVIFLFFVRDCSLRRSGAPALLGFLPPWSFFWPSRGKSGGGEAGSHWWQNCDWVETCSRTASLYRVSPVLVCGCVKLPM